MTNKRAYIVKLVKTSSSKISIFGCSVKLVLNEVQCRSDGQHQVAIAAFSRRDIKQTSYVGDCQL